ncbi:MAG TPA: DinB family protein [Chitinophagaceae bacterium]|nr:DinB family protein [Chitinophagaceae bacterium]HPH31314.1 DinB family protein [Chitinophagaceae bacterium]HPN59028.1 DinB family protein [Chitinophagaceae bacterium]
MPRPDLNRVPVFYHKYIAQVEGDNINEILSKQAITILALLNNLPAEKRDYRYGPDKWTVKEVLQHIMDAERVFAYRALCIARGEQQALPGFDENLYADKAQCTNRKWSDMTEEFRAIRRSTEILFASFNDSQLDATGTASGWPVYVSGIGYLTAGHAQHHLNILLERYL